MVRPSLETQLARVDDWVHREFSAIDESLEAAGCGQLEVSGPGRVYSLAGRRVLRADPKRQHLALGFPERLRADVQEMTGALREQRSAAWFHYRPDSCDRDTVELLLDMALRTATDSSGPAGRDQPEIASGVPSGPLDRREQQDEADLALVLDLVRAFAEHGRVLGTDSRQKVLREALFFHWEGPRLPAGGKRSAHLKHSPAARAQRSAGEHGGLVYEHVLPVSHVVHELLSDVPQDVVALRAVLEAVPQAVIITKAEDAALDAAGVRHTVPDDGDPWSRYRAAHLDPGEFAPLVGGTGADEVGSPGGT